MIRKRSAAKNEQYDKFAFIAGFIMGWDLVQIMFEFVDESDISTLPPPEESPDLASTEWGWRIPKRSIGSNYYAFRHVTHMIIDEFLYLSELEWIPALDANQMLMVERRLFELHEDLAYDYALEVRDVLNLEDPPFPGGGLPSPPLELYENKNTDSGYEWGTVSPSMYQLLVTPPSVKMTAMLRMLPKLLKYVAIDLEKIEVIFDKRAEFGL